MRGPAFGRMGGWKGGKEVRGEGGEWEGGGRRGRKERENEGERRRRDCRDLSERTNEA